MTHIWVSKLTITDSDNGLLPGRCQAIIWTNAGILLMGPLRIHFNEILIEIHIFSFTKMHLKVSSGKWRPSCLSLNVLTHWGLVIHTCVIELNHHWSRKWLVICSAPSHYFNQGWCIVSWTPRKKLYFLFCFDFYSRKCIWKYHLQNISHLIPSCHFLNQIQYKMNKFSGKLISPSVSFFCIITLVINWFYCFQHQNNLLQQSLGLGHGVLEIP